MTSDEDKKFFNQLGAELATTLAAYGIRHASMHVIIEDHLHGRSRSQPGMVNVLFTRHGYGIRYEEQAMGEVN